MKEWMHTHTHDRTEKHSRTFRVFHIDGIVSRLDSCVIGISFSSFFPTLNFFIKAISKRLMKEWMQIQTTEKKNVRVPSEYFIHVLTSDEIISNLLTFFSCANLFENQDWIRMRTVAYLNY